MVEVPEQQQVVASLVVVLRHHGGEEAGAATSEQRLRFGAWPAWHLPWHEMPRGLRHAEVIGGRRRGMLSSGRSLSFEGGANSGRKLAQTPVCANDGGAFGRRSLLDRVFVESRSGPMRVVPTFSR